VRSEKLLASDIEAPRSPVKTGSPLSSDKLRGMPWLLRFNTLASQKHLRPLHCPLVVYYSLPFLDLGFLT
jgi:hypothetical protein